MAYREARNYDNLEKAYFEGVGEYGIPVIEPDDPPVDNWISFNYAKGCEDPEIHGIHFFVDDYQFTRLWRDPDRYLSMLRKFQAVCAPDFSTYTDFPKAMQVWSHYRKHWLGAYWQMHGIRVIPTISWSDHDSYDWCFDEEPMESTVIISSVGTQADPETRALFLDGYKEMMQRLRPKKIILYGRIPEGCEGNIVNLKSFQEKWRR